MKYDAKISDLLAFSFTIVILIFAASGPLNEFVRWFIEATTADFEELSRREQRMLFKEHWLGAFHRAFERSFLLPTGIILGLPLILSFAISFLNVRAASWLRWIGLALTIAVFSAWIGKLFAVDAGALPSADPIDFWVFPLAVALTLYLTWKQFGSFIIFFCLFWIIYFFVRGWLPEWTGIFAGSDSTIANLLTGRFTGGAAHAAVASSALFGTLSGAAISNVVSTGVMTIPVIKKSGFRPAFAAGVEAAASTGGQIMPPVMGVVAFFVAGQIGLEYRYIVVAAIMPAIFYYVGTFLTVYFEARRQGIGPLPKEARVPLTSTEKRQCLVFIVPLGVLSYYLFAQPSVPKAGFYGFLSAIIMALILFPAYRSPRRIFQSLVNSGRMAASIVVIVAAIGLIVGLIEISGFSGRLSLLLSQLANGPLFVTLIVVALGSIVLGMGLPPGATYFIIVIALSSGIDMVGIAPLTLHLFVVFFAVISTVTPPVALAAFAAAPIAGANPIDTAFQAARLSLAGFIIPFVFVYHPALLYKLQILFEWFGGENVSSRAMIDIATVGWGDFAWITLALGTALWLLASAISGYEKHRIGKLARILRGILAVLMLLPNMTIAIPAFVAGVLMILWHRRQTDDQHTKHEIA